MENATKALMIAGAVLIAIMIIGVGMMIFNSGSKTINDSIGKLNQVEIQSFNSELEGYEDKQKGTVVKELISKIMALNATNESVHDEKVVEVIENKVDKLPDVLPEVAENETGKKTSAELTAIRNKVTNGQTYMISFGYTSGLITKIKITGPLK